MKGVRLFPPPPKGFDALAATKTSLVRHGLPQRPDPRKQPGLAALWEQHARRYQGFEHLKPELVPGRPTHPAPPAFGLFPLEHCGYELVSLGAPLTILSGKWTVPNLNHSPTGAAPNQFRTFFGLGFLDVHVEMTVDTAQNITTLVRIHTGAQVALPVRPGDMISAVLCLQTNATGTANYFLANETTTQTVNLQIDTGFPPAVTVNAGISRGRSGGPPGPLARFGAVYFDELLAWTTNDGTRLVTDGVATTMTASDGSTLARSVTLNDNAFKVVYEGD
jgi:Peptidase A4 family